MKLSYRTHDAFEVENQKITVVGTNQPVVYTDLVNGIQEQNELLAVFDDKYDRMEIHKTFDWIGDVGTQELVVQKYLTKIERSFIDSLTGEQRNKIHDQINELFNVVSEQIFMLDIPISVNYEFDFKKLFKYCGVHFDQQLTGSPYDIIETILKVHEECAIKSCVVLTNVAHYLTRTQFEEIEKLIKQTNQALLLIEFTEMGCQSTYGNSDFYYIDEDFIDWHS